MKCPICYKEMYVDDTDYDYKQNKNGDPFLVVKRCWTECPKCNILGYYETRLQYADKEGNSIKLEPIDEEVIYCE